MNILVFGDSIAWGAWDHEGGWVARLHKDVSAVMLGQHEPLQAKITYMYNVGRSGDTSSQVLARFDQEADVRGFGDVVIFQVGVNDTLTEIATNEPKVSYEDFVSNMETLITKAKTFASTVLVIGLLPVDDTQVDPVPWKTETAYRLEIVTKYHHALKETCERTGTDFLDLFDRFSGEEGAKLMYDGLHPNTPGHELIYQEVKNYLEERNTFITV